MLLFFGLPTAALFGLSFADYRIGGDLTFPTMTNYAAMVDLSSGHAQVIGRTLLVGLTVVVLCILISTPLAYYLAIVVRSPLLESAALTLVAATFLLGPLVRTVSWRGILGLNGLINALLLNLGLTEEPLLGLLYGRGAMITAMVYNAFPFMLFTAYLALKTVDPKLIAAARDLGASATTAFWRIVVPLGAPGVYTGAVLVAVPTFSAVLEPEMLGGTTGRLAATTIRDAFFHANNWPMGATMTVALVIAGGAAIGALILLLTALVRAFSHFGISLGTTKRGA
jgi:ABC-type spermidine/putrescine transport system permease subunit I